MMNSYMVLIAAVLCEVTGTLLLPASQNFTRPLPTVVLFTCYGVAFYLLTFVMQSLPIAIVYACWSGLGVFTIALLSYLFYGQSLAWQAICGLFLIVGGVVLVTIYSKPSLS